MPSVQLKSYKAQAYTPEQESWRQYLKAQTTEEEYEVLDCLARKESRWSMTWNYMNPTGDVSSKWSAYGIFQILESTARGTDPTLDRMQPFDNIDLAVKLYRKSGASPWLVADLCQ